MRQFICVLSSCCEAPVLKLPGGFLPADTSQVVENVKCHTYTSTKPNASAPACADRSLQKLHPDNRGFTAILMVDLNISIFNVQINRDLSSDTVGSVMRLVTISLAKPVWLLLYASSI